MMKRRLQRAIPVVALAVVLLMSAAPQPAAAYNTGGGAHTWVTYQAYYLLKEESGLTLDDLKLNETHLGRMQIGNNEADECKRNHFMDPGSHAGLLMFSSAGLGADICFQQAEDETGWYWQWYWIGQVLHRIQDLTVPHHTNRWDGGLPGHGEYEAFCDDWAKKNGTWAYRYMELPIFSFDSWTAGGLVHYDPSTALGWVDYAAHESVGYPTLGSFDNTASTLVPFAARLSAGFILFAYHTFYPDSDVDKDGLTYSQEMELGTYPWKSDTDSDCLTDGKEVVTYKTNPLKTDTDSDGLTDYEEIKTYYTNALKKDTDGDGLTDYQEVYIYLTKPRVADSDGDKMPDGWEVTYGLNPNDPSDAGQDMDRDGVSNADEYKYWANPKKADTDGDGLTDKLEIQIGTFPCLSDSDGDGWSDYYEHTNGYDPMDPDSHPSSSPEPPPGPILDP